MNTSIFHPLSAPALRASAPARWPWWCRRSATRVSCRPGRGKRGEKISSRTIAYTMFIACWYLVYTLCHVYTIAYSMFIACWYQVYTIIPCLYHAYSMCDPVSPSKISGVDGSLIIVSYSYSCPNSIFTIPPYPALRKLPTTLVGSLSK